MTVKPLLKVLAHETVLLRLAQHVGHEFCCNAVLVQVFQNAEQ